MDALRVLGVAAAVLAVAGCSATHVGESWQCPLAQGTECASVAAADPAVPEHAERAEGRPGMALDTPLYRVRADTSEVEDDRDEARPCDWACGPVAWLSRLLGLDAAGEAAQGAGESGPGEGLALRPAPTRAASARAEEAATAPDGDTVPEAEHSTPAPNAHGAQEAAASADAPPPAAAQAPIEDTALREAEVIGRIWIAPFVDAGGIYREGHWVRAVLAPGAWRLP